MSEHPYWKEQYVHHPDIVVERHHARLDMLRQELLEAKRLKNKVQVKVGRRAIHDEMRNFDRMFKQANDKRAIRKERREASHDVSTSVFEQSG